MQVIRQEEASPGSWGVQLCAAGGDGVTPARGEEDVQVKETKLLLFLLLGVKVGDYIVINRNRWHCPGGGLTSGYHVTSRARITTLKGLCAVYLGHTKGPQVQRCSLPGLLALLGQGLGQD